MVSNNNTKSELQQQLPLCQWALSSKKYMSLYVDYHDNEWGIPCFDEVKLYEMMILESAQAGLSWITILNKREGYRQAFDQFNVDKVAAYGEADRERLLNDSRIIRNRQKINAAINNSRVFLELQKEFGSFSHYLWRFVDGKPIQNNLNDEAKMPVSSPISDKLSKDLKRRGCQFVGSVTMYSYMQSLGLINDHWVGCHRHLPCQNYTLGKTK